MEHCKVEGLKLMIPRRAQVGTIPIDWERHFIQKVTVTVTNRSSMGLPTCAIEYSGIHSTDS
jgi:hypothetical protein